MSESNLKNLIKSLKLDYVNPDITENNFPDTGRLFKKFKLYHSDKIMTSKKVIKKMGEDGFKPANLRELLIWGKKEWNRKDSVVALDSVWQDRYGDHRVPCLIECNRKRKSDLFWFNSDWYGCFHFLFLAVSKSYENNQTRR